MAHHPPRAYLLLTLRIIATLLIGGMTSCAQPTPAGGPPPSARPNQHLALGNPSGAAADVNQPNNYLIVRDQYALAYDRDRGIPGWVSWHLQASDLGTTERYSGPFITDTSLPEGWYRVTHSDYTGSGYDRGHMTPSADRTASAADNEATFILSNVLPQAPANNQGLWAQLEDYARTLARQGNELYIIAGGAGSLGTLAGGKLTIPASVWKVLLVLPAADGDDASRVNAQTEVIAVWTPNDASVEGKSWQDYTTSVGCIEQRTGYDFFAAVEDAAEAAIAGPPCSEPAPAQTSGFPGCAVDPGPGVAPDTPVRIVAVDKQAETVTLMNTSAGQVSLEGWQMCSVRGGQSHPISGTIAPGATRVFPGPAASIWSNGEQDPGALYDDQGRLVSYWPD